MLRILLFNLHVNNRLNQISENAHVNQYADGCLLYCSDSESEIPLNRLQESITKLEKYFFFDRLNLNNSKTEFIIFPRKNDKRLQNSETVVVGSSRIEKLNQYGYLGVTIDKQLGFQIETKKVLKKWLWVSKPSKLYNISFHEQFFSFFQALTLSHFEYSALFLLQITSTPKVSLKKKMNCALKFVYFRSSIRSSLSLKKHKSVLGIRQRIELKSLTYFFQYINNRKKHF